MFLCVLRAQLRTQNTQKHIQKDELRLRRKVYEPPAPRLCNSPAHKPLLLCQFVAYIGHGQDILWVTRVGFYFAAQAANVDPDKIDFAVIFWPPYSFQEDFVGQNDACIICQGAEQLVFGAAQLRGPTLHQYQVLGVINGEIASCEDSLAGRLSMGGAWRRKRARERASNSFMLKGLSKRSSAPRSNRRTRSSSPHSSQSTMTGVCENSRSRCSSSIPLMSARRVESIIISGSSRSSWRRN